MRTIARSRLPAELVEDTVQDVMFALWSTALRIERASIPMTSWVAMAVKISKRRIANALRSRGRSRLIQLTTEPTYQVEEEEDVADPDVAVVGRFRGRRQRVIASVVLAGGTLDDCVEILGVPRKELARTLEAMVAAVASSDRAAGPSSSIGGES